MMRSILTCTVLVPLVAGCAVDAERQTAGAAQQPANLPFQVQVVADFESPWAMTFLPDGRMLITEKSGILYVVSADGQQRKRVDGIPSVSSEGQGGLMDVVLHPGFTQNRLVYFSYAEAGQGGKGVVLARGRPIQEILPKPVSGWIFSEFHPNSSNRWQDPCHTLLCV